eukprot:2537010-Rhodomonas_salina.6
MTLISPMPDATAYGANAYNAPYSAVSRPTRQYRTPRRSIAHSGPATTYHIRRTIRCVSTGHRVGAYTMSVPGTA